VPTRSRSASSIPSGLAARTTPTFPPTSATASTTESRI
jgi:hypothetical protein